MYSCFIGVFDLFVCKLWKIKVVSRAHFIRVLPVHRVLVFSVIQPLIVANKVVSP